MMLRTLGTSKTKGAGLPTPETEAEPPSSSERIFYKVVCTGCPSSIHVKERIRSSRMKQIPGPCTQPQEFILLLSLRFWAIYAQSKWPAPGVRSTAQRRCAHVSFVFCTTSPPSMVASAGLAIDKIDRKLAGCCTVIRWRRRRRGWLMACVVNYFWKQVLSTTSHLSYCLFC